MDGLAPLASGPASSNATTGTSPASSNAAGTSPSNTFVLIRHDGVRLTCEAHSTSVEPPTNWVLFVSGMQSPRGMWAPQLAALQPNAGAVTLDNRGVGDSDFALSGYTTHEMALDAIAALDHATTLFKVPARKVHVVGHSLGAMIAIKAASILATRAEPVESLTLISGSLGGRHALPPLTCRLISALPLILNANTPDRKAKADLRCHFSDSYLAKHRTSLHAEYVQSFLEPTGAFSNEKAAREGRRRGEAGHLKAVWTHAVTKGDVSALAGSSVRVVHGRGDGVAGVSAGKKLARRLGVSCEIVPGAHMVTRENSREVNGIIDDQVTGRARPQPEERRAACCGIFACCRSTASRSYAAPDKAPEGASDAATPLEALDFHQNAPVDEIDLDCHSLPVCHCASFEFEVAPVPGQDRSASNAPPLSAVT
ncbi:Alpha/Beta hydrolase protein [Pelagophyceae sp. CCMP2097]|nr:Alpha/Beta hydrolase protein [Pelagophyceae sp. CCMP2097]